MSRSLHIVSFDIPYPPNYGGIIDVFYKLKSLSKLGINIYLHVFEYNRERSKELEKYCIQIFYYERNSNLRSLLSKTPFRVKSRSSIDLIDNLNKKNAPILFEGLHTTFPLIKEVFNNRLILVRTHNIEHVYLNGLSKSERKIDKKIFFKLEAKKFFSYESILNKANYILTISPSENIYFRDKFENKAIYVPVFHQNNKISQLSKKGEYAYYHGDLRVADNIKSAHYLIDIFKNIDYPLIIASSFMSKNVLKEVDKYDNIKYIEIKDNNHIIELFEKAHINVLPTFQKTGIKLKLINSLFNGRFCIVTPEMAEDTGLEELCIIGKTKQEFSNKIIELIDKDFPNQEVIKRSILLEDFNVKKNAQKIVDLL